MKELSGEAGFETILKYESEAKERVKRYYTNVTKKILERAKTYETTTSEPFVWDENTKQNVVLNFRKEKPHEWKDEIYFG